MFGSEDVRLKHLNSVYVEKSIFNFGRWSTGGEFWETWTSLNQPGRNKQKDSKELENQTQDFLAIEALDY